MQIWTRLTLEMITTSLTGWTTASTHPRVKKNTWSLESSFQESECRRHRCVSEKFHTALCLKTCLAVRVGKLDTIWFLSNFWNGSANVRCLSGHKRTTWWCPERQYQTKYASNVCRLLKLFLVLSLSLWSSVPSLCADFSISFAWITEKFSGLSESTSESYKEIGAETQSNGDFPFVDYDEYDSQVFKLPNQPSE